MRSSSEAAKLVNRAYRKLEFHREALRVEEERLVALEEEYEALLEAHQIVTRLAESTQKQAHAQIASIVTRCLRAVFDDPYDFEIVFERKRGKTEASFQFIRDGVTIDPLGAAGGGVVDVASFGLRLACLILHRPKLRRILIADEPFRFVSRNYLPNVVLLLEELSKELGVQIIFVTHIPELMVGTIEELG